MLEKTLEDKIEESHIVFITSKLDAESASSIILDIMRWNKESKDIEINIYLSSRTYDFVNAVAIYDVLTNIENPISVFCIGYIGGFAPLILAAASNGKKYGLKHTTISLNQPFGYLSNESSQQTEVEIEARETSKVRNIFEKILAERLSKDVEVIHNDVEKDREFTIEEAKKYGLIDVILE